jgi:ATP-binding cassette subfamily F protein 3
MLQVANVKKSYGAQEIFADVSFTVNPGERVGLVGRNGSGKTTLFRLLLGQEHPDAGSISMPAGCSVGHLSQHIRFTEESVLGEAALGLPKTEDHRDETYKVKAILLGLGFSTDDFDHDPSELSGGFQVRLNLAKVLVSEPVLLLLDEPTNYLDILSIRWLTQFLRSWKNELILITHDRAFMDSVTTHTMGLHRCRIKKIAGPTRKLYDQIVQEEEIYEQTRLNDEKARREAEAFINRFRAQATKARAVQSRIKALDKKEQLGKLDEIKTLDFEFRSAPFSGKRLLTAEELTFSFAPEISPLIRGLTLAVGKKDRIGIIGKNGKGKTTLLNLLAKELAPRSGEVKHHADLKPAYFGQTNIDRLDPKKTALQEVMDAHPDNNLGVARSICGLMMFEGDNALKKVSVLSGGERSRVLLGKLLVSPANLLLLDEPTNHLDMYSIDSLIEAIDAFDGALMIVTHSELILNAVATRLVVFDDGVVRVFEGTYHAFLERVGWKSETTGPPDGRSAAGSQAAVNKKDMRRMRAEVITDRSKILSALDIKITALEENIVKLEQAVDQGTQALVAASAKKDGEAIRKLSKTMHDAKEKIETLFSELEVLAQERDEKAKEFEQKLSNLQATV